MGPESAAGALVPGAGVFAYDCDCAALGGALSAYEKTLRRNGGVLSPRVAAYRLLFERAAADYQRQHIDSAGTSVVAKPISASPRSDWVDVRHAALVLGLTERQIRNLCENNTLRAAKDVRHRWLIDPQSIENERVRRAHGKGEHRGTDSR